MTTSRPAGCSDVIGNPLSPLCVDVSFGRLTGRVWTRRSALVSVTPVMSHHSPAGGAVDTSTVTRHQKVTDVDVRDWGHVGWALPTELGVAGPSPKGATLGLVVTGFSQSSAAQTR